MNQLEQLRDLAYNKSIDIYDYHISDNMKAMCLYNDICKSIAMDMPAIESIAEEKEVLAEEIGHYETNSLMFWMLHTIVLFIEIMSFGVSVNQSVGK